MTSITVDAGELLTVAEVARKAKVKAGQVRRWLAGIRVGGQKVTLKVAAVYGTRCRIAAADLATFESACRRAKFGDQAAATLPPETPAKLARRGADAKARLAKMLEN